MAHLPPAFPKTSGIFPKQAHVDVPEGTFEDEHGRQGFSGRASHVYHKNAPTGWERIEGPLHPHAYDLNKVASMAAEMPKAFLGNSDVTISIYAPKTAMPYFRRNADGDEVWFIHEGSGLIETDLAHWITLGAITLFFRGVQRTDFTLKTAHNFICSSSLQPKSKSLIMVRSGVMLF